MWSHNSNVSNFGDAATKPCFDYTMEVPRVPEHYKHYASPSTLPRPKQPPPEKPPTAARNNFHTSRHRKCTAQNQDVDDGNLLALALILQATKGRMEQ